MKIRTLVCLFSILIFSIGLTQLANGDELTKGQWVRYAPILNINVDPSLELLIQDLIPIAQGSSLVKVLENIEWMELKVDNIQGNEVTLSKTINQNGNIQQSEPITIKIQNEKPSFVISTNVNLGHTLETPDGFAPITLVGIKNLDSYIGICFVNPDLCEEKNVETLRFHSFRETSQNNVELLTEIEYVYEKSTGILLRQYIILDVCTSDYSECGLVEMGLEVIDFSIDGPKIIGKIDPGSPSKQEIVKRLSEFLVKTQDSRFLITDGQESISGPIKTTYDIIRMKDNSWLGTLIIYGDEEVTSVTATTTYDMNKRTVDDASDILQLIRIRLVPGCCGGIENHNMMFLNYFDDKQHSTSKTFENIELSLSWRHNDGSSATGFFGQEIQYLLHEPSQSQAQPQEESMVNQDQPQKTIESSPAVQESNDSDSWGLVFMGFFFVVVIPIVIIVLVVWKIKRWRAGQT